MAPSNADEAAILAESYWETLKKDVLATLEEYESEGFDTSELHPGMTAVLAPEYGDDLCGLGVLVLENELQEIESLVESPGFDEVEIYASQQGNIVLLGVFLKSTDPQRVIGFPSYYLPTQADTMLDQARAAGELSIRLQTQFDDSLVIDCVAPELFVPETMDRTV